MFIKLLLKIVSNMFTIYSSRFRRIRQAVFHTLPLPFLNKLHEEGSDLFTQLKTLSFHRLGRRRVKDRVLSLRAPTTCWAQEAQGDSACDESCVLSGICWKLFHYLIIYRPWYATSVNRKAVMIYFMFAFEKYIYARVLYIIIIKGEARAEHTGCWHTWSSSVRAFVP